MLNPASEPIVKNILPALRSVVARELDSKGFSQTEIAELMQVTQPAVSYYLNRQRGGKVKIIQENPDLSDLASQIASYISKDDLEGVKKAYREFCSLIVGLDEFEEVTDYDKELFTDF
ncbi:MAG: hypothetical protein SVV03_03185 [Candidatus Nanohaloarchaea archaeon]|nr:hypothetical protein [Candidatus Nanohaloarchaea archaeon]